MTRRNAGAETVRVKMPYGTGARIERAARQQGKTRTDFMRGAILGALAASERRPMTRWRGHHGADLASGSKP